MDELYTFFEHMIVGNYENLVDIIRNDNNVNKSTQIPQSRPPYWKYITPILIYHIVKQVLKHNIKVENKLNQTEGMCITEKGLGVTMYTTLLMFIREQWRIHRGLSASYDLSNFKNPVFHLVGNFIEDKECMFYLPSCLSNMVEPFPDIKEVSIHKSVLDVLHEMQH